MVYEYLNAIALFFYSLPPWMIFLLKIAVLLAALEFGYRLGLKKYRDHRVTESEKGNIILTSIFALLGLMFAFTFSASVERHDQRKLNLVEEANAIGTAYLRAELAADPGRSEIRAVLLDIPRRALHPGRD